MIIIELEKQSFYIRLVIFKVLIQKLNFFNLVHTFNRKIQTSNFVKNKNILFFSYCYYYHSSPQFYQLILSMVNWFILVGFNNPDIDHNSTRYTQFVIEIYILPWCKLLNLRYVTIFLRFYSSKRVIIFDESISGCLLFWIGDTKLLT